MLLLLNEHGDPSFLFPNLSSYNITHNLAYVTGNLTLIPKYCDKHVYIQDPKKPKLAKIDVVFAPRNSNSQILAIEGALVTFWCTVCRFQYFESCFESQRKTKHND